METNDIIDDHLIHNPHEGLGKLQSIIRVSGVLAVVAGILSLLGIFQQLYSVGQQAFRMMSSSFDKYIAYDISNVITGLVMIITEAILMIFLFKFGLVAMNAGKKKLGRLQWDGLFKDLRNILMTVAVYILMSLLSYVVNIFLQFIL